MKSFKELLEEQEGNNVAFANSVIGTGLNKVKENALKLTADADVTKVRDILNAIVDESNEVLSKIAKNDIVTKNATKV
jgi:hypothetical protein